MPILPISTSISDPLGRWLVAALVAGVQTSLMSRTWYAVHLGTGSMVAAPILWALASAATAGVVLGGADRPVRALLASVPLHVGCSLLLMRLGWTAGNFFRAHTEFSRMGANDSFGFAFLQLEYYVLFGIAFLAVFCQRWARGRKEPPLPLEDHEYLDMMK